MTNILLPVPYLSQWSSTAELRRTDCGPTSVGMVLSFYGLLGSLTVDQLSRETVLASSDNGLTCAQLVALATKHGLTTQVSKATTLDQIRAEISAGRPVITLIAYRDVSERMDKADDKPGYDLHFIVVIGFDDDNHFTINDPDWWSPRFEDGHNLIIQASELNKALGDALYSRQCVFVVQENAVDTTFLQKISTELKATAAEVDAQIAANAPAPTPTPTPAPVVKAMVVNTDVENVRDMPTVHGAIVGTLSRGTAVNITDAGTADSHTWGKLADGQFVGSFVAADLLIPKA